MIKIERDKLIRALASVRTGLNVYTLMLTGATAVIEDELWDGDVGVLLHGITHAIDEAAQHARTASCDVEHALELLNELDN